MQSRAAPLTPRAQCDTQTCKIREQSSLRITYTFPRWLLARSVEISLSLSALTGAGSSMHLRIPRVLEIHEVWQAIEAGDLEWIRRSLATKVILPTDVDEMGSSLALVR